MKILYLVHGFPPIHTAGAENYTFNIAQAMVEQGHEVYVLCVGIWDDGERYWNGYTNEMFAGIHVRRLNLCWYKGPDPNRYLYDNPVTAGHLRDWLTEIQPDIIHVTSCYTLSSSVIQVCKERHLPIILTLVDFWFICPSLHLLRSDGKLCDGQTTPWDCLRCMLFKTKAYRWLSILLPESVARVILTSISKTPFFNRLRGLRGMALNMSERKQVLTKRLRQANVILAPSAFLASIYMASVENLSTCIESYGHDLSWLQNYHHKIPEDVLHFCYLGQICHDKGVHILIEAFLNLEKTAHDVVLDIWGGLDSDSPYVRRIHELAASSNNIHLHGGFSRTQLADVLSQSDVVVVPSIWYENNPLVIQEAFAAQVPVIATDLGGMSEFVQHGANGLLFESDNVTDLLNQMQRVVNEPSLLSQLRKGILPVKTIEQEVAQLMVIYEQSLGDRKTKHDTNA